MIQDYEIPKGTQLYFGKSAKKKREIENLCAQILSEKDFEEIHTPIFSYHQESVKKTELISFSDEKNHILSLRADNSLELTRLIEKRLGRTTKHRKWFYAQPIFSYPSTEVNQIGAEHIGSNDIAQMISIACEIMARLGVDFSLQIGNLSLPKLVAKELGLDLEVMINHELDVLEKKNISWLNSLIRANVPSDLPKHVLADGFPPTISDEILRMNELYEKINYEQKIISPMYYTKLAYYDNLFFRLISDGKKYAMGGVYKTLQGQVAVGFALYTDAILDTVST